DQHLVMAAAPSMEAAAGVAQALDQPRLDRGMAVLETLVEHEGAAAEIIGQRAELAVDAGQFARRQDADALQALGVREAGDDVVEEEFAVEDDIVAGQEGLDLRVDGNAGFLPEQVGHGLLSGMVLLLLMLSAPL